MENNEIKDKNNKKSVVVLVFLILLMIVIAVIAVIVTVHIINENEKRKMQMQQEEIYYNNNNCGGGFDKPIIYLYPEETTNISIKFGKEDLITCSYPKYEDGWNVIANPDGTLIDTNTNRKLYALYWEGKGTVKDNFNEGFVVKGEDSINFLEEKLNLLGLNERESEEFIVYWLPILEKNKYNYIRFATTEEMNEYMPLEFSTNPDTLIRVLMEFKGVDEYIEIPEQQINTPERKGFTVVEWGGTEITGDVIK